MCEAYVLISVYKYKLLLARYKAEVFFAARKSHNDGLLKILAEVTDCLTTLYHYYCLLSAVTHAPFHASVLRPTSWPNARDCRDWEVN